MSVPDSGPENGHVPEGAAVFPEIPEELGIDPLLLAVMHSTVFLAGSDNEIVQADAADEALQQIALYLQRLEGARLRGVLEDMACLTDFARKEKWPKGLIVSLRSFLTDMGVETDAEEDKDDGD